MINERYTVNVYNRNCFRNSQPNVTEKVGHMTLPICSAESYALLTIHALLTMYALLDLTAAPHRSLGIRGCLLHIDNDDIQNLVAL